MTTDNSITYASFSSGVKITITWEPFEKWSMNFPYDHLKNIAYGIAETIMDPTRVSSAYTESMINHGLVKAAGWIFNICPLEKIYVETDYLADNLRWRIYNIPNDKELIQACVDFYSGKGKNWMIK